MIVYSAVTGQSVGRLFAAGVCVGLLLVVLFSLYIFIRSYFQPDFCPPLPKEERVGWGEKFRSLKVLILPGILMVATVGSILTGLATPTEGAGVGAFGALLFSVVTGRFRFGILHQSLMETLKVTSMIGWMIGGAAAFSSVFAAVGGNQLINAIALNMPGGEYGVLFMGIAFIFLLGMFLETMAIILLAAPILSPIMAQIGFDQLWWAILFMTLLQAAYITPPFGVALFYLKGVTPPHIRLVDIYAASLPFIGLQMLAVLLLVLFPALGLWLPRLM
jgi:tripartite ATP-independent transporter DctM subunit